MLMDNNSAYQELAVKSGTVQAQKIIVTKAQAELAVSKKAPSDETKSSRQNRDRGQSR